MQPFKIDEVVQQYVAFRDEVAAIGADAKAKAAEIEAKMQVIEAWLMNQASLQGVDSFKTASGTAFVKTVDFCSVGDWDSTVDFIKVNNAWELLNRAVNKTAVREYIDANGVPPPGVNFAQKKEIQVRRK